MMKETTSGVTYFIGFWFRFNRYQSGILYVNQTTNKSESDPNKTPITPGRLNDDLIVIMKLPMFFPIMFWWKLKWKVARFSWNIIMISFTN